MTYASRTFSSYGRVSLSRESRSSAVFESATTTEKTHVSRRRHDRKRRLPSSSFTRTDRTDPSRGVFYRTRRGRIEIVSRARARQSLVRHAVVSRGRAGPTVVVSVAASDGVEDTGRRVRHRGRHSRRNLPVGPMADRARRSTLRRRRRSRGGGGGRAVRGRPFAEIRGRGAYAVA